MTPQVIRVGHLLVSAVLMSVQSLLSLAPTMAALETAATWNGLAIAATLVLVSGQVWARAVLRSGHRKMPDFTAGPIASPMGPLLSEVLQMLIQGPDAITVGTLTVALVASGIAMPMMMLLRIQAVTDAIVVTWGVHTNHRVF